MTTHQAETHEPDAGALLTAGTCPECGGGVRRVAGTFTTCGGCAQSTALHCDGCGRNWVDHPERQPRAEGHAPIPARFLTLTGTRDARSAPETAASIFDVPWTLAKSGISVDVGILTRVRMENTDWDTKAKVAAAIVAVPDLVAALQAAVFALGRGGANAPGGPGREEWEQAKAALAKAGAPL